MMTAARAALHVWRISTLWVSFKFTLRPPYQQKYFFRPIGAFFLLKLKVTKIPIQNRAKIGPNRNFKL